MVKGPVLAGGEPRITASPCGISRDRIALPVGVRLPVRVLSPGAGYAPGVRPHAVSLQGPSPLVPAEAPHSALDSCCILSARTRSGVVFLDLYLPPCQALCQSPAPAQTGCVRCTSLPASPLGPLPGCSPLIPLMLSTLQTSLTLLHSL